MEAITWFILGICVTVAAILLGCILAIAAGLADSPLYDDHYVD